MNGIQICACFNIEREEGGSCHSSLLALLSAILFIDVMLVQVVFHDIATRVQTDRPWILRLICLINPSHIIVLGHSPSLRCNIIHHPNVNTVSGIYLDCLY